MSFATRRTRHNNYEIVSCISLHPIHTTRWLSLLAIAGRINDISGHIRNRCVRYTHQFITLIKIRRGRCIFRSAKVKQSPSQFWGWVGASFAYGIFYKDASMKKADHSCQCFWLQRIKSALAFVPVEECAICRLNVVRLRKSHKVRLVDSTSNGCLDDREKIK